MPRGRKAKDPTTEKAVQQTTVATKETKAKKPMTETVILQSAGAEWNLADVKERVLAAYVAQGHRRGRVSEFTLYLKPEEHKAYYVINGKITGDITLD